jgi:low affinity Fe/Cu permease
MRNDQPAGTMPSDVTPHVGKFDRFAGAASDLVSRSSFFTFAVVLVVVWAPTLFFLDINTSQLLINTATTIGTWILVSLLQNTQKRADQATQHKLNALAAGLAELMAAHPDMNQSHVRELRAAVGLEKHESSS